MAQTVRDFFPRQINQYVPLMQYASDVIPSVAQMFSLGEPALGDTDGLLDGVDTTAVTGSITVNGNASLGAIGNEADAPYGRNVTVTGAGVGAKVLTIKGRDYLGQPMAETVTCSSGDAAGKKAFYWVDEIDLGAVAGDSDTDFGWGDVLGLPYKCFSILDEISMVVSTGVLTNQNVGAFVVADQQVATATTGDPRGTYNPTVSLDGLTRVYVVGVFSSLVVTISDEDYGGLHGNAQYYA